MVAIRRQIVETSETADAKIEWYKSTVKKNIVISAAVGGVVILLLLLFCYIRRRNGRNIKVMTRKQLEKRKKEFKRVLEPNEIKERKDAALARRSEKKRNCDREYAIRGVNSIDTVETVKLSYDIEACGVNSIQAEAEDGGGGGIELSPLHSDFGENTNPSQNEIGLGNDQCEAHIRSPHEITTNGDYGIIDLGRDSIEVQVSPIK